jgi:hypothetical protein
METSTNIIKLKNIINVKYNKFGKIKSISSILEDHNLAYETKTITFELKTGEIVKIDKDTDTSNFQKVIHSEIFYNSLKIELTDETIEELKKIEKYSLVMVVEHDFKEIWGRFVEFKHDPNYSQLLLTNGTYISLESSYCTQTKQIFVYETPPEHTKDTHSDLY